MRLLIGWWVGGSFRDPWQFDDVDWAETWRSKCLCSVPCAGYVIWVWSRHRRFSTPLKWRYHHYQPAEDAGTRACLYCAGNCPGSPHKDRALQASSSSLVGESSSAARTSSRRVGGRLGTRAPQEQLHIAEVVRISPSVINSLGTVTQACLMMFFVDIASTLGPLAFRLHKCVGCFSRHHSAPPLVPGAMPTAMGSLSGERGKPASKK